MSATGFLSAQVQFLDDNADPLDGGLVYFYQAGTSTPQNTYTDSALAVANANPVVLDSAGRAVIYFSTTPAYKCILKDSAGVTIWTQDNISPAMVAT